MEGWLALLQQVFLRKSARLLEPLVEVDGAEEGFEGFAEGGVGVCSLNADPKCKCPQDVEIFRIID